MTMGQPMVRAADDDWACKAECAWCGEPDDGMMTEWVNPSPSEGGPITEVGHVGCAPADWPMA
jgi:hypothetical protein